MMDTRLKRTFATVFLWVSMLIGLFYLKEIHISYIISLSHYQMFNAPSLAYTFMCFFHALFPIFLITPPIGLSRRMWLKCYFYVMGICFLLGNTWVIYFLMENPVSALSDFSVLQPFQQSRALTLNYLTWATYDLWGVLFSTIQGVIYIFIAHSIGRRITRVAYSYVTLTVNSMLFPVLYCLFAVAPSFSAILADQAFSMYLNKNLMLIAADIFISIALILASTEKGIWFDLIIVSRGHRR